MVSESVFWFGECAALPSAEYWTDEGRDKAGNEIPHSVRDDKLGGARAVSACDPTQRSTRQTKVVIGRETRSLTLFGMTSWGAQATGLTSLVLFDRLGHRRWCCNRNALRFFGLPPLVGEDEDCDT